MSEIKLGSLNYKYYHEMTCGFMPWIPLKGNNLSELDVLRRNKGQNY